MKISPSSLNKSMTIKAQTMLSEIKDDPSSLPLASSEINFTKTTQVNIISFCLGICRYKKLSQKEVTQYICGLSSPHILLKTNLDIFFNLSKMLVLQKLQ